MRGTGPATWAWWTAAWTSGPVAGDPPGPGDSRIGVSRLSARSTGCRDKRLVQGARRGEAAAPRSGSQVSEFPGNQSMVLNSEQDGQVVEEDLPKRVNPLFMVTVAEPPHGARQYNRAHRGNERRLRLTRSGKLTQRVAFALMAGDRLALAMRFTPGGIIESRWPGGVRAITGRAIGATATRLKARSPDQPADPATSRFATGETVEADVPSCPGETIEACWRMAAPLHEAQGVAGSRYGLLSAAFSPCTSYWTLSPSRAG